MLYLSNAPLKDNLYSKTYLKMHEIAQNGVNALRLHTWTLHKQYKDFTQLLTQDETISSLWQRTYVLTNLVTRYPGFAVPLMFASKLHKGTINRNVILSWEVM